MTSRIHELKIAPEYMAAQLNGIKNFEIRKNDRDFLIGDQLWLREWADGKFTGRETTVFVTYVTNYKQKDDHVVLGTNTYWFQEIGFLNDIYTASVRSKKK